MLTSITSKIDESLIVTKSHWVVSLVQVKSHAEIIIEKINESGDYEIIISDFLPKDKDKNKNQYEYYARNESYNLFLMTLGDEVYDATVRSVSHADPKLANMNHLEIAMHINEDNKHQRRINGVVAPSLNISDKKRSFCVLKENAISIMRKIGESQVDAMEGRVKFNIYGKNVTRLFKQNNHNCTTWAVECLQYGGIILANTAYCSGVLPARTADYSTLESANRWCNLQ